jgi:peptide/nickel transport system substrate-binding protein
MPRRLAAVSGLCLAILLCGCHRAPQPGTVVMVIESSPTNLDPRIGTDAQSERIDELLFDGLVERDNNFQPAPGLAESWDHPEPLTWIFHLRSGVRFSDGRQLTAKDAAWTLNSMRDGTIVSGKTGAYKKVASVEAPDDSTLVIRLKSPDPSLLWNLSGGAFGVVPAGSGKGFARQLIGSGPFRLVSEEQDKEVVLERSPTSWHTLAGIERVRFAVVPDAITRALQLRKGSADIALNSLTPDMAGSLARDNKLQITKAPGTVLSYFGFNMRDPILRDQRVREAMALAINRPLIIQTLLGGLARPADSILPPNQWAYDTSLTTRPFDPVRARQLLDEAGYRAGKDGVRFHLAMKTSTDEGTRLLAAVFQQQMRDVGIALDLRSYEFATFYADVTRGAFQVYSLRWIGGNEDPDIFRYAFLSGSTPPTGANRGGYSNPEIDRLITDASSAADREQRRKDYIEIQQILAHDLPAINLWYLDNVAVTNRRVGGMTISPSGNYKFLETITILDSHF